MENDIASTFKSLINQVLTEIKDLRLENKQSAERFVKLETKMENLFEQGIIDKIQRHETEINQIRSSIENIHQTIEATNSAIIQQRAALEAKINELIESKKIANNRGWNIVIQLAPWIVGLIASAVGLYISSKMK